MKANKENTSNTKTRSRVIWITLAVFLIAPHIISTPLTTEILIFGLFALGFNLLLGYTGILSFGHAAYFGLGCYGCGIAIRDFGLSIWGGLLVSIVVGILLAAIVGAIAIKKRGVYFAMISMAIAQMFYFMALISPEEMDRRRGWVEIYPQAEPDISIPRGPAKPLPAVLFCLFCSGHIHLSYLEDLKFSFRPSLTGHPRK